MSGRIKETKNCLLKYNLQYDTTKSYPDAIGESIVEVSPTTLREIQYSCPTSQHE